MPSNKKTSQPYDDPQVAGNWQSILATVVQNPSDDADRRRIPCLNEKDVQACHYKLNGILRDDEKALITA